MEALIGWPVQETTLKSVGMKNRPLLHLRCLGRFSLVRTLTGSSLGSNSLGSLGRMSYGRDSPSLPKFGCHFPPLGPSLWPARMGTEV